MKALNGIINEAEFCPSPNFNDRPAGTEVDLIVVHAISLPKGIYIAMNGRCFNYDKVKKNKETGIFEGI